MSEAEKMKRKSLRHKIYQFIKEWMNGFTMHGFSNVNKANNIMTKIAFVLILICMISYCGYS